MVQELLKIHDPDRLNLIDAGQAWRLLMETPRHYKDEVTFTDSLGEMSVNCSILEEYKDWFSHVLISKVRPRTLRLVSSKDRKLNNLSTSNSPFSCKFRDKSRLFLAYLRYQAFPGNKQYHFRLIKNSIILSFVGAG